MFTLPVKSLSSHCHCPLEQLEMVEVVVAYLWLLTTWLSLSLCRDAVLLCQCQAWLS